MDELQCEICANWYNEDDRRPKNLPCGHSYCSSCMTKELAVGRTTCPTCRRPHNANSVEDLPTSVTLERLIRNMPKKLNLETKSSDSEDEDYSGGPCSKHKKSVTYFYCSTHSLQICRECTVINHVMGKCEIISIEEQIGKKKDEDLRQASSTRKDLDETLAVLGELVKEKQEIVSEQELKIQKWKKSIEEASKMINEEQTASEGVQREIANGQINGTNVDAAKRRLKNAITQKSISRCSIDIRNSQTIIEKWMQDMQAKFEVQSVNVKSSSLSDILENISKGKLIYTETTILSNKAIALLTAKDKKIQVHTFKHGIPQRRSIALQYNQVLGLFQNKQPTSLFVDLKHNKTDLGRFYLRIQPELGEFIKHIPAVFSGVNGTSILGFPCWDGSGKQNLVFKFDEIDLNDLSTRKQDAASTKYGEVICVCSSKSITQIAICVIKEGTQSYGVSCSKIGFIESGLNVVVKARSLGTQEQANITISDCGIVLEL